MTPRAEYQGRIEQALRRNPVVALLGARQVGKTTLAREFVASDSETYFDLEDPAVAVVMENPMTVLEPLRGLVVIDEAQRQPGIFPVLRVLADRAERPATFLVLGSASPELRRQAAESLAGRVEIIEVSGFSLGETGSDKFEALWLRGGFPRSFLAESDADSFQWRSDFISTFLERDLALLGFHMAPSALRRFWIMISHYNGQIWNGSEIAGSLGISPNTARNYLDALEQTFMVRQLRPWHANLKKRLVKTPKLYFRDSGLFHTLQGIHGRKDLLSHPKLGASWESFALEQVLKILRPAEAWFYAIHSGSELDLYLPSPSRNLGVEFKFSDAPKTTRSMRITMADLNLDELWIVYPGKRDYALEPGIQVRSLAGLAAE